MTATTTLRCWSVLAAALLLVWAGSVHTPWAPDTAPRLWLYDTVFYLRFVVLAWGVAELLRQLLRRHWSIASMLPLVLAALTVLLAIGVAHTATGLRLKVAASAARLTQVAEQGERRERRRAGHLLIDAVSTPCSRAEPWLWIGRPYGAGTGTSLALVHGGDIAPLAPGGDAFRFRPVTGRWWLAYQHAARHARAQRLPAHVRNACTPGRTVSTHRQGLDFVDAGWRQLGREVSP